MSDKFLGVFRPERTIQAYGSYGGASGSGRVFELGLQGRSCRCDRWGPCRQADACEVGANRGGLRQGRDDAHGSSTTRAFSDVEGEHACEQLAPGEPMRARRVGRPGRRGPEPVGRGREGRQAHRTPSQTPRGPPPSRATQAVPGPPGRHGAPRGLKEGQMPAPTQS